MAKCPYCGRDMVEPERLYGEEPHGEDTGGVPVTEEAQEAARAGRRPKIAFCPQCGEIPLFLPFID